jgi:hypothetical protein
LVIIRAAGGDPEFYNAAVTVPTAADSYRHCCG